MWRNVLFSFFYVAFRFSQHLFCKRLSFLHVHSFLLCHRLTIGAWVSPTWYITMTSLNIVYQTLTFPVCLLKLKSYEIYITRAFTLVHTFTFIRELYFQGTLSYCLPSFLLSLKDSFNCFHKDSLVVMNSLSSSFYLKEFIPHCWRQIRQIEYSDNFFFQHFILLPSGL